MGGHCPANPKPRRKVRSAQFRKWRLSCVRQSKVVFPGIERNFDPPVPQASKEHFAIGNRDPARVRQEYRTVPIVQFVLDIRISIGKVKTRSQVLAWELQHKARRF
jgi:hypothetical protein